MTQRAITIGSKVNTPRGVGIVVCPDRDFTTDTKAIGWIVLYPNGNEVGWDYDQLTPA